MNPMMQDRDAETRSPEEIFEVFRDGKLNRLQGLEIAEAIIEQSRRTDIPVKTFLGLMRTESNFAVRAVSSSRAMGLMQIHPVTWKRYTEKLSLSCSREEAFRPSVNVMVSAEILRDLYDKYQGMGYQEPELWDHVFSAYYSGEGSVRGGLNRRHRHYVNKVRTHINEYSQKLDG
jgi:soluble lytic murein transglycosylase-like protein